MALLRKCVNSVLFTLGVVGLSLFICPSAWPQVAGATLSGTVTDSTGAALTAAKIVLKSAATGVERTAETDSAGVYSMPNIPAGTYQISASASGFSTQSQNGIVLEVGATRLINISLHVGSVSEVVQVAAENAGVQLANSTISGEVNAIAVRDLPLNGRDWTQLATLQAGVTALRAQASTNSSGNRGNRGFGNELSDAGHSPFENNYRLNGISINDYSNGSPGSVLAVQLGVDAIQEFSVLTKNYSAEYGRTSGAVINAITRSGTNSFHGSAYWFLRDEGLDARNYFDSAVIPPFHRNDFGASGGGPIQKDKTFFFANYEGIRQDMGLSFHDTVPTAAARAGNLCSVPTTGTCTPTQIAVDPKVAPYLPLWPAPNGGLVPGGNGDVGFFNASGQAGGSENYATAKVDHIFSTKDNLAASWFFDNASVAQPDALLVGIHDVTTERRFGSIEETHVFNPSILNTVRLGFNRTAGFIQKPVSAINPLGNDQSLGSTPGTNSPILSVPGLTLMQGALGDPTFTSRIQNSYQAYDDAFITRGVHSLRVGFSVEHLQLNALGLIKDGRFTFPSLQGFLLNQPTSAITGDPRFSLPGSQPGESGQRQTVYGVYIQDDWRLRSNLTVNLGLRYEPATNITEANSGGFGLNLNLFSGGMTLHVPKLWQTNPTLKNFDPRVGFAWDPFRNGKTAVRGAFGIYDALPLTWQYLTTSTNPPFLWSNAIGGLAPGSFPTAALQAFSTPSTLASRFVQQNPSRSYSMNWNFGIERQLTSGLTASLGYTGSHSLHLNWVQGDQNMVLPTLTSAGYLWPFPVGSGTRLNPSVGAISAVFYDVGSTYDDFQAQVTKNMGHGVQFKGAYTWGKCIDTSSSRIANDTFLNSLANMMFFNKAMRRGLCDFQITHNFVLNYIWQVPTPRFGGATAEHILGGWEISGIVSASTGTPFSVLIAGDPLGQKNSTPSDFPDRLWGTAGCSNPINVGNPLNYLKLNCFTPPTAPASFASVCKPAAASVAAVIPNTCMNLFGNSGRNTLIGPGLVDFDFSAYKNNYIPRISETFNLQFRFEVFNIFNRANFQAPIDNSTIFTQTGTPVAGAGAIDATTTTSRQIQLGLKVIW
jgi:carboxypeptidase family protein/TonB-dependent receptor-like protein